MRWTGTDALKWRRRLKELFGQRLFYCATTDLPSLSIKRRSHWAEKKVQELAENGNLSSKIKWTLISLFTPLCCIHFMVNKQMTFKKVNLEIHGLRNYTEPKFNLVKMAMTAKIFIYFML